MCFGGRRGPWGALRRSLTCPGVAGGPEAARRRRGGVVSAAAALPNPQAPARAAASLLRPPVSRRELALGRVVGVGDVGDWRAQSPPHPRSE